MSQGRRKQSVQGQGVAGISNMQCTIFHDCGRQLDILVWTRHTSYAKKLFRLATSTTVALAASSKNVIEIHLASNRDATRNSIAQGLLADPATKFEELGQHRREGPPQHLGGPDLHARYAGDSVLLIPAVIRTIVIT